MMALFSFVKLVTFEFPVISHSDLLLSVRVEMSPLSVSAAPLKVDPDALILALLLPPVTRSQRPSAPAVANESVRLTTPLCPDKRITGPPALLNSLFVNVTVSLFDRMLRALAPAPVVVTAALVPVIAAFGLSSLMPSEFWPEVMMDKLFSVAASAPDVTSIP